MLWVQWGGWGLISIAKQPWPHNLLLEAWEIERAAHSWCAALWMAYIYMVMIGRNANPRAECIAFQLPLIHLSFSLHIVDTYSNYCWLIDNDENKPAIQHAIYWNQSTPHSTYGKKIDSQGCGMVCHMMLCNSKQGNDLRCQNSGVSFLHSMHFTFMINETCITFFFRYP